MPQLPGGRFLRANQEPGEAGVLTSLLRAYIEERDRTALDTFFELLYDEHFTDLAIQVHSYGKASEVTVQEVIDDSLAKLLEDVTLEKYRKAPESAAEHLKYLLLRRFIDRRRYWDRPHEDVSGYRERLVDADAPDPAKAAAIREKEALIDQRLSEAIAGLSKADQDIVRLRLEGLQYPDIAKKLGIAPDSIWVLSSRAVERLFSKLVMKAPTLALKLNQLKAKRAEPPKKQRLPTLEDIRAALPRLTERVRDVLERLHVQGVSRDVLTAELGEQTLQVLLRRGYDLLEAKFQVSFPEAFDQAAR